MDFNALLAVLIQDLGVGAAGAVILFGIGVAVDNVAGVLLAKIKGHDENGVPETFAWNKLGSFLESQFGTKKAAIVLAAVASAVAVAFMGQVLAGANQQTLLQVVETVALSTAVAGATAQFAAVAADAVAKIRALIAK